MLTNSKMAGWRIVDLYFLNYYEDSTKNRNILIELSFIDFSKVREISLC